MTQQTTKPVSDVVARFMRYCSIPSQSDPFNAQQVPSSQSQFDMARQIQQELLDLGAQDVTLDEHAYVTAFWPASAGAEDLPVLGFCTHIDTAWQSYGDEVHPQIKKYEGGKLIIGTDRHGREVYVDETTNPQLKHMVGWDLITSDGTSLLGGDDKAADAMIMSLLYRLKQHPELPHPRLALSFVPDEEIGHGASLLNLNKFGATFGYTIDGGPLGEFCYETFNAAEVTVQAKGLSVHTGTAKGALINASEALMKFNALLPAQERPEYTEGRDGFYYLSYINGNCEEAKAGYILRDHSKEIMNKRKQTCIDAAAFVNKQYGSEVITLDIQDQYFNMADVILKPENKHLIENARRAYKEVGVDMFYTAMRGGTDGAQLSYRGFAAPNLSACYYNGHGVREFVPVPELETMVDMLQHLVAIYANPVE